MAVAASPERPSGLRFLRRKALLGPRLIAELPLFELGDGARGRALDGEPTLQDLPDLLAHGTPPALDKIRHCLSTFDEKKLTADRPGRAGVALRNAMIALPRVFSTQDATASRCADEALKAAKTILRKQSDASDRVAQLDTALGALAVGATVEGGRPLLKKAIAAIEAQCQTLSKDIGLSRSASEEIALRNAHTVTELYRRLVWAKTVLDQQSDEAPTLAECVAALTPILRALQLGGGELPHAHGGGRGTPGALERALQASGQRNAERPKLSLGYARMHGGRSIVLMDCEKPPKAATATASTLALEMSSGRRLLIVNTGPDVADAQHSLNHSTLVVGNTSSSSFQTSGRTSIPSNRPKTVAVERAIDRAGLWLLASHDGYCSNFGVLHERRLFLAPDGRDLRGEDTASAQSTRDKSTLHARQAAHDGALPVQVHFHLHPDVAVTEDGDGFLLTLLSEEQWSFRQSGGTARLAASQYSAPDGPRDSLQIVIGFEMREMSARVNWVFRRVDGMSRATRDYATP
ncbi:MAG: heparinase II/III family protein [Pseudomonadota bacterium]